VDGISLLVCDEASLSVGPLKCGECFVDSLGLSLYHEPLKFHAAIPVLREELFKDICFIFKSDITKWYCMDSKIMEELYQYIFCLRYTGI
jgi:hypothetical protein